MSLCSCISDYNGMYQCVDKCHCVSLSVSVDRCHCVVLCHCVDIYVGVQTRVIMFLYPLVCRYVSGVDLVTVLFRT